jgi:hypothetical protein
MNAVPGSSVHWALVLTGTARITAKSATTTLGFHI